MLDASAVLALLFEEIGWRIVRAHLRAGVIGTVNLAEVLAKLSDAGLPFKEAVRAVRRLDLTVVGMNENQAERSAALRPLTRKAGLSLGDRACIALAMDLDALAVTADRGWEALAEPGGFRVRLIR